MAADLPPLARPGFRELEPYEPIDPPEVLARELGLPAERIVKLDGNENPYGPSPLVGEALARLDRYHLYPDPLQRELRDALARHLGLGAEHIVCGSGSDEENASSLSPQRQAERAVIAVLVLATQNHPQAAGKRVDRFESRIDIGGLGVVIPIDASPTSDELEPVLDSGETFHGRNNSIQIRSGEPRGRNGGHHVGDVVPPAEGDLGSRHDQALIEVDLFLFDPDSGRHRTGHAEPERAASSEAGIAHADRVVSVQNGELMRLLCFEQAAFCRLIRFHRAVTIQVVGRHVQRDGDVGAKVRDGLQLEAGDFEDVPLPRTRGGHQGANRSSDVTT
jgi:hypothetical protein